MDCITVEVIRKRGESWGIQISGEAPCYVESVANGSPADEAGLQVGDFLISINGVSVYNAAHRLVVQLIAESDRVVRFRILPNEDQNKKLTSDEGSCKIGNVKKDQKSGTSQDCGALPSHESQGNSWKNDKHELKPKKTVYKNYDLQIRYDKINGEDLPQNDGRNITPEEREKSISVEQNNFIVTREDQQQFDEHYELEGNFAGRKASAPGAFTGDFNVIMSENCEDVRGVKSRVLAGIQHFSFDDSGQTVTPEDQGKIFLYTTSLGIHRSVAAKCGDARKVLRGFRVKFEERDIFADSAHKDELFRRLGLAPGDFPQLPMLYIDGVQVGSGDEIQEMSDCGDLRIRLQDFQKYNIRQHCPSCKGTGVVTCTSCKGKCYRQKNRFTRLKCSSCNLKGKVECCECL